MMRYGRLAAAAGAMVLGACGAPANATDYTITRTLSSLFQSNNSTGAAYFQGLDLPDGLVLKSATFSYRYAATASQDIIQFGTPQPESYIYGGSSGFRFAALPLPISVETTISNAAATCSTTRCDAAIASSGVIAIPAADLPTFAGASTLMLAATGGINGVAQGPGIAANRHFSLSASGTMTYLVGSVPEPATWGMIVLGMGAIGFALRRRRQAGGATARLA